jgi:hypothetical protein
MMTWLKDSLDMAKGNHYLLQAVYLRPCLRIVAKAHELSYNDVVNSAVKTISKFGHILYNEGQIQRQSYSWDMRLSASKKSGNETYGKIMEDCMNMFQEFSFEIKYKIVAERLLLMNDECSAKI